MKTAMIELNEKFSELSVEDFYAWIWNNRKELLELERKQIIEAHGDKLKKSRDSGNYEFWFKGKDYYEKTFENKPK